MLTLKLSTDNNTKHNSDKVLYEEMMTNDDNFQSNLLTSIYWKYVVCYKFCKLQVAHVEPDICVVSQMKR